MSRAGDHKVNELLVRRYSARDEQAVIDLWDRCGLLRPWNNPGKDISRKLSANSDWFLVAAVRNQIVGSIMIGYEGHRGWINYLAVDPGFRRQGIGRRLMKEAEVLLRKAGCPKINLQLRANNKDAAGFYAGLGYVQDDVISLGKRIDPDCADSAQCT
jgi:ribosomal protein S18 acetylase RimI-like enzyme